MKIYLFVIYAIKHIITVKVYINIKKVVKRKRTFALNTKKKKVKKIL